MLSSDGLRLQLSDRERQQWAPLIIRFEAIGRRFAIIRRDHPDFAVDRCAWEAFSAVVDSIAAGRLPAGAQIPAIVGAMIIFDYSPANFRRRLEAIPDPTAPIREDVPDGVPEDMEDQHRGTGNHDGR